MKLVEIDDVLFGKVKISYDGIKCCMCGSDNTYSKGLDFEGKDMPIWRTCLCDKESCTGHICVDCYQLYDPKSSHNKRKSETKSRTGHVNIEDESGKGLIGEAVIAKVRGLEIVAIKLDNFRSKFDLTVDVKYGHIQSKLKLPYYGDWYISFGMEHNFHTLLVLCIDKYMKNIERIYVIPEEELYGIKTLRILENNNSKWEKFRIDEKSYNNAFHSLMSYLKHKISFGIEDIKGWLDVGVTL